MLGGSSLSSGARPVNGLVYLSRLSLLVFHGVAPLFRRLWRLGGMVFFVPRGVFNPVVPVSSVLLVELVRRYARGLVVDIGCGSGVLSVAAARLPRVGLVLGVDSSLVSVAVTRVNAWLNEVEDRVRCYPSWRCLLGEVVSRGGADTVVVNPPYLPCDPLLPGEEAWCGGKDLSITLRLLGLSLGLLRSNGVLLASLSSLSGPEIPGFLRSRAKCFDKVSKRIGTEEILAVACRPT